MSEEFGLKLKLIRQSKKLSQSDLAKELCTTKATISKWENNQLEPNLDMLKALALYLNVSIDTLMNFNKSEYYFEYDHADTKLIHKEKK